MNRAMNLLALQYFYFIYLFYFFIVSVKHLGFNFEDDFWQKITYC